MISREELEGLARLARIELREEEIAPLQKDISDILGYVGQLSALEISADVGSKTEGGVHTKVAPAHHNVMRGDVGRAADDNLAGREAVLRAAFPKEEKGYDVVRKILHKDE